jgi:hypothetical protein
MHPIMRRTRIALSGTCGRASDKTTALAANGIANTLCESATSPL